MRQNLRGTKLYAATVYNKGETFYLSLDESFDEDAIHRKLKLVRIEEFYREGLMDRVLVELAVRGYVKAMNNSDKGLEYADPGSITPTTYSIEYVSRDWMYKLTVEDFTIEEYVLV